MKRLFTFGCSYTSWAWPTWADMLIYEYRSRGLEGYNFGRCGAGNQYIFTKIIEADRKYKFTQDDVIIVEWTTMQREDRFANNRWHTPGNIYTQNIYTEDFVNRWADPVHYVIRDCTYISTIKKLYNLKKFNYIDFSMSAFKYLDSANFNMRFEEVDTVLSFYGEEVETVLPPMMEYLDLHIRTKESREQRLVTYWPHDKNTKGPEWHPIPLEHFKYLDTYILPALNETLSERTLNFIEEWSEKVLHKLQPIDLEKTGWKIDYSNHTLI